MAPYNRGWRQHSIRLHIGRRCTHFPRSFQRHNRVISDGDAAGPSLQNSDRIDSNDCGNRFAPFTPGTGIMPTTDAMRSFEHRMILHEPAMLSTNRKVTRRPMGLSLFLYIPDSGLSKLMRDRRNLYNYSTPLTRPISC